MLFFLILKSVKGHACVCLFMHLTVHRHLCVHTYER